MFYHKTRIYISDYDRTLLQPNKEIRLLGLANFIVKTIEPLTFEYLNNDKEYALKRKLPIIQWIPEDNVNTIVIKANMKKIEKIKGYSEKAIIKLKEKEYAQFFRFGFVKLDKKEDNTLIFIYVHD